MRRFYAPPEDFSETSVELSPEQSKHINRVLRLTEGAAIKIFDGTGREYLCEISEIGKKRTNLRILEQTLPAAPESDLDLTLAPSLLKGEKFDLVIQKAVELGVTSLVPIITARTDVRVKHIENKLGRWRKIIIESSKQCGRAKLMEVSRPLSFEQFAGTAEGSKALFYEGGGGEFSGLAATKKITAVFGPEGGWEESEIRIAIQNGFEIITLGGRILRAETAAISISALLQYKFGDLN